MLIVIVAVVLIGAVCPAAASAFATVVHVLEIALTVALVTVAAAAGLGVLGLLVWAGIRVSRTRAGRVVRNYFRTEIPGVRNYFRTAAEVIPPQRLAIEPPQPRFDPAAVHQSEPQTVEPWRS